jgi:hypothetical protein
MVHVFISWSGPRSKAIAKVLYHWLPRVMQAVEPWMSTDDILKGERWSAAMGASLQKHRLGIICVTPENVTAPWLMFEAGALSRSMQKGKVIPLLLGLHPDDLRGPLREFNGASFTEEDILGVLRSLNEDNESPMTDEVLRDVLAKFWPDLSNSIAQIATQRIPGDGETVRNVLRAFANRGLGKADAGEQALFESGFESHSLYGAVGDVMRDRLYICGRKNRKLFDKEHRDLVRSLSERIARGFDFRVLFLDPAAPPDVMRAAHLDDNLPGQLTECIANAKRVLAEVGVDPSRSCRLYSTHRTVSFTVVDEAVLFAPIALNETGRAKALTKAPFSVITATSPLGGEMVEGFKAAWNTARPVT